MLLFSIAVKAASAADPKSWPSSMDRFSNYLATCDILPLKFTAMFGDEDIQAAIVASFEKCNQEDMTESFRIALIQYSFRKGREFRDIVMSIVARHKDNSRKQCSYLIGFYNMFEMPEMVERMEAVTPENIAQWAIRYLLLLLSKFPRVYPSNRVVYKHWFQGEEGIARAENMLLEGDRGTIGLASKLVNDFGLGNIGDLPSVQISCDTLVFCYFEIQDMLFDKEECDDTCKAELHETINQLLNIPNAVDLFATIVDVKAFRRLLRKIVMLPESICYDKTLESFLKSAAACPTYAFFADIAMSRRYHMDTFAALETKLNSNIILLSPLPEAYENFLRKRILADRGLLYRFVKGMPDSVSISWITENCIKSDMVDKRDLGAYLNIESRKKISIALVEQYRSDFVSGGCATLADCQEAVRKFFIAQAEKVDEMLLQGMKQADEISEAKHKLNTRFAMAFNEFMQLRSTYSEALAKSADHEILTERNSRIDETIAVMLQISSATASLEASYQKVLRQIRDLESLLVPKA